MLSFIPVVIIGGFLGGCAVVVTASCFQLIKLTVNLPRSSGSMRMTFEA